MGKEVRQQKGLSHKVLKSILENYKEELLSPTVSREKKRKVIMAGAYFVLLFGGSLRGNEGLMLEGQGLCKHIGMGKSPGEGVPIHVLAPLLGCFESETGERLILVVLAGKSESGIEFRWWLEMLVKSLILEGKHEVAGPAFCLPSGVIIPSRELNEEFIEQCVKVQLETDLIPNEIHCDDKFGTYRSFRIGSNTRARSL